MKLSCRIFETDRPRHLDTERNRLIQNAQTKTDRDSLSKQRAEVRSPLRRGVWRSLQESKEVWGAASPTTLCNRDPNYNPTNKKKYGSPNIKLNLVRLHQLGIVTSHWPAMIIGHARTMIIAHACTMLIVHACIMSMVHARAMSIANARSVMIV